jgi:hypothetical protein
VEIPVVAALVGSSQYHRDRVLWILFELGGKKLYIVEVGELESFCKSVGNHGPKWVNEVMEKKDLQNDEELKMPESLFN